MGRFQSCKGVVERALRRAFYDGVLELYEGHGSTDTVTAVTLEGMLTLTINKAETLVIRLNEVAQRAEETANEDPAYSPLEEGQVDLNETESKEKEKDLCSRANRRKRKQGIEDGTEDEGKFVREKGMKVERDDYEGEKRKFSSVQAEPIRAAESDTCHSLPNSHIQTAERSKTLSSSHSAAVETEQLHVKKEPNKSPVTFASPSSPGTSSCRTDLEESTESEGSDLPTSSQDTRTPPIPVLVKKEPKAESILIDDDDDDDDGNADGRRQDYRGAPQASPSHTLWYKMPHGPKPRTSLRHRLGKQHSDRKCYSNPHIVETADAHEMALLLERNDCPVCGEVLHSRTELDSHLHAHRQALQSTCSVCQANTLTLDALMLHLSTVHSPRSLPVPVAAADSLFSQAILPASPYAHSPMSAIASLVSMAACQSGSGSSPDPAVFLGGGGMANRMSSLMEQIITYRGMLPCPICQLLCSSKQHMAAHLTSVHGAPAPGRQAEGRDGFLDEAHSESQADGVKDSDNEGLTSSSFFCFDCSMGFSSQAAYAQHCLLQHGATSVVSQGSCSVCHRAFDTWKDLHSHYLSAHGVTNFCDRCKMGFVSATELKSHYESTHGSAEARSLTFICDICNKGFYSQSQCSAHKRSHISEKSFACQVCGSAFFKRGDLSKHFRTVHAPNRVFSCRFCGKRGTRMDNMRSHVKSHGKHMSRDEILSFIEEVKS